MCYTSRHDFGLDRDPTELPVFAGMTQEERKALWDQMAQLFDNDIAPYMDFKDE